MVNLGNTLFARSLARHEADMERKRQEELQFAQLAQQGMRDVEAAKNKGFERQMEQAELEGRHRQQLGMAPAPRPDNAAIAQALGIGGMGAAAEQARIEQQRGYQTEDRDLQWDRRVRELATQHGRQRARDATSRYHDIDKLALAHEFGMEKQQLIGGQQRALQRDIAARKVGQPISMDEQRKQMKEARGYVNDWMGKALQGTGATMTNTANGIVISAASKPKSKEAQDRLERVMMVNDMLLARHSPEQVLELASIVAAGGTQEQLKALHAKWMQAYMPDFSLSGGGAGTSAVGGEGTRPTGRKGALIDALRRGNTEEKALRDAYNAAAGR